MVENYLAAYGIKIFVSLIIFITLIVMFARQSNERTNNDPQRVKNVLSQLESDYEVLTNVMVPGDRGMFDLGYVVVSPYGVFVITVKQTIGKIFGRKGDPRMGSEVWRESRFHCESTLGKSQTRQRIRKINWACSIYFNSCFSER